MNNILTHIKQATFSFSSQTNRKLYFLLFVLFVFSNVSAQHSFVNNTLKTNYLLSSVNEVENYLENKFNLKAKGLQLSQDHEIESLTGKHITFACLYNGIKLKEVFIKVHINQNNQLFLIQENVSSIQNFIFESNVFAVEKMIRKLSETYLLESIEKQFVMIDSSFQETLNIILVDEKNDIYLERNYTSENVFTERDLKVHFAPIDTTVYGKVFQPDPLSSAHENYGGNYQDGFVKDTNVLIIKKIPNVGQSYINSMSDSFDLYGVRFGVNDIYFPNNYSGDTVYYYFEDIYLNADNDILDYKVFLSTDISGLKTVLRIEDYDYPELNAEQYNIEVLGDFSDGLFHLKNNFFELKNLSLPSADPVTSITGNFVFNRSHNGFEEINTFYHLNNYHAYVQELGFTSLAPEKIFIDAHGNNGGDNSYFTNSPAPRLVFGDGGVDDAEDASVIIHEYTHALSDFAAPNTNWGAERQALDEALGDYISSSYSSVYSNYNKGIVFPWDGHNEFWDGRISNSDSTYSSLNLSSSIYVNAEIMSATLMDIFDEIGKNTTDKLVIESMFYNMPENNFMDVANNLLLIDSLLFENENKCAIYNVLVKRNFKEGFCIGESFGSENGFYAINTDEFSKNNGNAEFYVIEDNFEKMNVKVSNALGQIVFRKSNIIEPKFILDPSDFKGGMYYVRIQTNNKKYLTKLSK